METIDRHLPKYAAVWLSVAPININKTQAPAEALIYELVVRPRQSPGASGMLVVGAFQPDWPHLRAGREDDRDIGFPLTHVPHQGDGTIVHEVETQGFGVRIAVHDIEGGVDGEQKVYNLRLVEAIAGESEVRHGSPQCSSDGVRVGVPGLRCTSSLGDGAAIPDHRPFAQAQATISRTRSQAGAFWHADAQTAHRIVQREIQQPPAWPHGAWRPPRLQLQQPLRDVLCDWLCYRHPAPRARARVGRPKVHARDATGRHVVPSQARLRELISDGDRRSIGLKGYSQACTVQR
mmetsp:Transcript_94464/g.305629  ORF Transcript_94464/g.305629 Transcript_94464/m.305629 type:complete len:292 (-) Transcript_94464:362-1237(-)